MRQPHRAYFVLALILLVSVTAGAAAQERAPAIWSGLQPGPHAVGFRVTYAVDSTRTYWPPESGRVGRPIRVMIWYPGMKAASDGARLRFRDYLEVQPPDRFQEYDDVLRTRDLDVARRQFAEPADSLFKWLLGLETAAERDIPSAGRFPLVVHALGRNDYQAESTVLWEYLASHGYVVAVVPQMGAASDSPRLRFTLEDLEVQLRDIEVALAELGNERFVDPSRTAVIGHSSGAVVGLLLAASDEDLDALVSLDGSITTTDGRDLLAGTTWNANGPSVPVLDLYAFGKRNLDSSVLDSLHRADRYHIGLGSGEAPLFALHFDFQNWPIYSVLSGVEDSRGAEWRSSAMGRDFFVAACRLTRHFLDGALRVDPQAWRYVSGDASLPGILPELLVYRVQAAGVPR